MITRKRTQNSFAHNSHQPVFLYVLEGGKKITVKLILQTDPEFHFTSQE